LTNVLCDTAMLCAFAEERTTVDAALVMAAVEELQWVEYAQRMRERADTATGQYRVPARAAHASMDLLLHDQFVARYDLPPGRAIIGRTPDNDVQIRSKFISRHHAQITTDGTQSVLEDLNSTNGVFVDTRRIKHH